MLIPYVYQKYYFYFPLVKTKNHEVEPNKTAIEKKPTCITHSFKIEFQILFIYQTVSL